MFKGLNTVTYSVSDIENAKKWYGEVFGVEPIMDTSMAVIFLIGETALGLIPATGKTADCDHRVIPYWNSDDIESDYERLLQLGAVKHTEIGDTPGGKAASVIDPFGNILGMSSRVSGANTKTVEEQPSETAMGTAAARAAAFHDEREEIRGPDYLAEIFLSEDMKGLLDTPKLLQSIIAQRMPGMYEYLIARTAYFDDVFKRALRENISQIVFLGSGYDTRPYRFKDLIRDTRLFDLDIHTTQDRKLELLRRNQIDIPEQLTFVPINFNTQSLKDVLLNAGFKKNKTNLFIWEGVTYYLDSQAVDNTFDFVKSNSSTESTICFDYSAIWPKMWDAYGVKTLIEAMQTSHAGEPARFSIERGTLESFLSDRGYSILEHLSADEMESKYLSLEDGSIAGKIIAIFCFAYASLNC